MPPHRVALRPVSVPRGVAGWCVIVLCAGVIVLWLDGSAHAQDGTAAVHSHSLRQDDTALHEIDRAQRLRDLFLITSEEGWGYFEEMERHAERRRFISHYRKAALRRLRSWSLDLFAAEWPDGLGFGDHGGNAPRADTWASRAFDWLVDGTDLELAYGGGDGLTFSLGRDLDWRGGGWLVGSRVEVNPLAGEVALDLDLGRTSVGCSVSRDTATVSWTIPF